MGRRKKTQEELLEELHEQQGSHGYIITSRDGWEYVREHLQQLDSHGTLGVAASEGDPDDDAPGTASE